MIQGYEVIHMTEGPSELVTEKGMWSGRFSSSTFQTVHLSYSIYISWSTGFRCSVFCWRSVEPYGCSSGGIAVVPKPNGHVLIVGPWASRVAMRAHNRKIRFSPWRYLNLLDLHSLETLAEWTGKAAVLVSLCGQVAHTTPPLIRGFA
jgi:hypothetical protein